MRIEDGVQWQDFRGLIALHDDYVSVEQFVKWDFDLRIQKIGPHYRGFKRVSTNWKGNVGNQSTVSDMEVSEKHKLMIDECAKIFGGLDICALDLLHSEEEDKEYILELNDTAIGLVHEHEFLDMCNIRDVVIYRMSNYFSTEEKFIEIEGDNFLREQVEQLKNEINVLQTTDINRRNREEIEHIERESGPSENVDISKHPVVWFLSIIIVVLVGILIALLMKSGGKEYL